MHRLILILALITLLALPAWAQTQHGRIQNQTGVGSSTLDGILPTATGKDLGSSSARWDAFLNIATAGTLNNIRIVDGSTFTTIQAAINDFSVPALPSDSAQAGGVVYIPAGDFTISSSITVPIGLCIVGAGDHATRIINNSGNPTFVADRSAQAPATDRTCIKNLSIISTTTGSTGIDFNNVHNYTIENVSMFGDGIAGVGVLLEGSWNGLVKNVFVKAYNVGLEIKQGAQSAGTDNAAGNAIAIVKSYFNSNAAQGVLVTNTSGAMVQQAIGLYGVVSESNASEGIRVEKSVRGVDISACYLEGNGTGLGTAVQLAIGAATGRTYDVAVEGCLLSSASGDHISLDSASRVRIGFNTYIGAATNAINCTANATDLALTPSYRTADGFGPGTFLASGCSSAVRSFPFNWEGHFGAFLPGALTSAWTGWVQVTTRPVTVTRVLARMKTAGSSCITDAVVRVSDGTSNIDVTIPSSGSSQGDSGAISTNFNAGTWTIAVQTAAATCSVNPADANVDVQYKARFP